MNKKTLTLLFLFGIPFFATPQNIEELYKKADDYSKIFSSKYYYGARNVQSVNDSHLFTFETNTPKGTEYFIIDGIGQNLENIVDQQRLADSLAELLDKKVEPYNLPINQLRINNTQDSVFFNIEGEPYFMLKDNYSVQKNNRQRRGRDGYWGSVYQENSKERVVSPDGKQEAYISEGNVWVRELDSGKAKKLSNDGSPYEYYSSNIYWSPDSRKLVSCKYRPGGDRKLLLISSSPKDQLQPKTETYDYPKPGDALPVRRPVAFLLDENRAVQFDIPDVEQQYDLNNIKWYKDTDLFTFEFNKRGHQQYTVYGADVVSGKARPIVDEKASTFVYYSWLYRYWFEDSNELLWISERDGWRHLYLYDVMTGKVKKQVTKGDWIVKSVVNVDEKSRNVIFKGCGVDKNEDPYLEKYYMVNLDNGKLTALTPENGNHNVTFSKDYAYMFDIYSRTDLVPTNVVRSVKDGGKVIYKPELQPDVTDVLSAGWTMPEVFSAKGRDGVTDIWGMIIRPSNFDPSKQYPVIEYIYAGPHDSHVPKSFAIEHSFSALAELGFITVMIDGMGTANRSKAFHDVCWQDLKDGGFPDRIEWIKAAAKQYPEMNIDKVGIYGTSAGGQSAMGALLFHPEFYKVGVSSCACHDNRMDKIWWNEQWMGYPVGKHYEESSNMVNAHLLEGELMLILGELDNNVDPSSTLQVVDKLIEHDKEFEFVMLPGQRHTSGGKYGERKRRDFFVKHILKQDNPSWNKNDK